MSEVKISPLEKRMREQLERTKIAHIEAHTLLENIKAEAARVQKEYEATAAKIKKDFQDTERQVLLLQQAAFTLENALNPGEDEAVTETPETPEILEAPEVVTSTEVLPEWDSQDEHIAPEDSIHIPEVDKGSKPSLKATRNLKIGSSKLSDVKPK